ncbi:uncharacterized protein IL334_000608 [Kwoniella shivajii]|uniref:REJ domain-containing protein n=1 Tax=Kwoniella shivajii TaxID=564305 RepID=A0ABZ1CPK7_9TREE|nr:hypothetical protein IL334_000608 [Kwoniella shivajii]
MSSAAAATQNAATPASSVAASRSAVSSAAATSSAAASTSAVASSAAASSFAPSSSASASAAGSTSASASASTSAAAASSSISASASASSSISASSSSSKTSTANLIDATSTSSTSSKKGLSGGAIGGIVAGGIVGLLALALMIWIWKRKRRTRGEKVPPPPPMRHAPASNMYGTGRAATVGAGGMSHQRQPSAYSSLMAPPRPSSTFASHSRSPSSHINYPITTMATMNHDGSPPMPPSTSSNSGSSHSPPMSTGTNTPANALPSPAPGAKPTLAPIDTSLSRGGSASSDDLRGGAIRPPRHVNSIDRLRGEGNGSGPGSERAPSPASSRHPSESGIDYSRGNSPHTSMMGLPSSPGRQSYSAPRSPSGYPRPGSMASLGSSRYLHVGPAGRAPHQGRPINLTMPSLLGARPDENGDFFGHSGRYDSGYQLGLDEMGRMRKTSNNTNRQYNEQDYQPSPIHTRIPSSQSLSNRSRNGSDENSDVPTIPEGGVPNRYQNRTPRQEVADPHTVLQRQL